MGYRELMRRQLLERIYDKMSDEEKRIFVQLTLQDKSHSEIMAALSQQNARIEEVSRKIGRYPFASDLLANVAGNAITDGLIWLGKTLFKR
jgi:hypothetical protein